ncbi:sigma-70 family RNA polymerase sigma factor [Pseudomonas sp. B21-056]|jgi:RNA polymerase sigma factor for flagellar operon FliA|uniref:sigma-70 family RNA polymerase sigma factor n=1 Tax=Pseudomonas sp. B21-056 TaxID=2895495 RepID=UPI00222E8BEB|nr:sigma-70 family RNA polymerase sigma factor [Pseudomonas sp. B21-056]UZE26191.1 sigma-70 family RNA polymerase sigma factor [Pseudomonas sp. B21-056]
MATDETPRDGNDEQALWRTWVDSKTEAARSRLFFFYGQWLRMIVGLLYARYPHPLAEWGDYVNLASIGLLQAIDRFNPGLGTRFQSYAEPYVKGNVLKGLSCYVSDQRRYYRERLESISGSQEERAESDLEHVANVAIGLAFGLFLESGIVDQEPNDNNPLSLYEVEREGDTLNECVKLLSVNERQVIEGHYHQHLSFTEVSELMGISKSRVSQLHAQALRNIRASHERLMAGERW